MNASPQVVTFDALGTTASLIVTEQAFIADAEELLRAELDAFDETCSRFRPDSELVNLNNSADGTATPVTPLLFDAVEQALRAARVTNGLVDPTVGAALELIGYDRDFSLIPSEGPALTYTARSVPGWKSISLDRRASTVRLPPGVRIDLGATAKALCADRAANGIAEGLKVGVLVSLGGDIAVAGPAPADGWPVKISQHHADPVDGPGPTVSIHSGGLATSSTTVRRWMRGDQAVHHLIDPATSQPAAPYWATVSVAAASCLDANVASCAGIVLGAGAPAWLKGMALPARLERPDGQVIAVAGWPC